MSAYLKSLCNKVPHKHLGGYHKMKGQRPSLFKLMHVFLTEDSLKEMDLRCQSLEEDVRRVKLGKDEAEAVFGAQIEQLKADSTERDDCIEEVNRNLETWKVKHEVLAAARDELNAKITALGAEIRSRDDHLHQLHLQLIVNAEELRLRVVELEIDVKRKQESIIEGAEEKREVIRQLCFSIEHYRSGYHQLRSATSFCTFFAV
ncbi:protein NETWORKED 4A-like [Salvia splendens]|uniref:protein NETWORKED 4A-like n=1 Tax=Salvia splendens TaxID=180675 RepID=UPI001C26266E|nr:protein NETWORKED 4A-like [Salvia splendens]